MHTFIVQTHTLKALKHPLMWSNLHFDLLSHVFSFLSPDSLARAKLTCRNWHTCASVYPLRVASQTPWFLGLPTRNWGLNCCYVHNPVVDTWHVLSMEFLSIPIRPISSIGSIILSRSTNSTVLQLVICNPFTKQFRCLPTLNISRTNPAIGVVILGSNHQNTSLPHFQLYVAGGMSEAVRGGGAIYEPTLEMFDSKCHSWTILGSMPIEYSVRLTVWTPNESFYSNGVLYWITSARVYTVMGLEIRTNKWGELSVPLADKLEFAMLGLRNGVLTLVGGTCGGASVWELQEGGRWCLVDKVPSELVLRLLDGDSSWGSTKCVGGDGVICLYRNIGKGMVVWSEEGKEKGKWEWNWVDGCCLVKGKEDENLSIAVRGVFVHPNLSSSCKF